MKPEENTILSADTQAVLTDSATDSSPTGQLESQPLGEAQVGFTGCSYKGHL